MNVPQREKKGESAVARALLARRRAAAVRPRWGALAGSVLAGAVVGAWLWGGGSRNSLADDVLSHVGAERAVPSAAPGVIEQARVEAVLDSAGVRLDPAAGAVLAARTCRFRGRAVPHLRVRLDDRPVSLLVLRHEPVRAATSFAGGGFSGRIVPSGPGSLAVVAEAGGDVDQAAARLLAAVQWRR